MRTAVAATALGVTLTLAGLASCSGPDHPVEPPSPDPSATPVFASDEEALAAAEEAYGAYLAVVNTIGKSGWVDTSSLAQVARGSALADYEESAAEFSRNGYKQKGDSTFDTITLQQWNAGKPTVVTVYLCLDVSNVVVLDANNHSVVSAERPDRQAREVDVDNVDGGWKVSRSESWSGANFC